MFGLPRLSRFPSSMIYDVLIVGAGLAGLKAARDLQAAGRRVVVLDKGRGVGGRAATRRWDGVPVDHGAQFFTARSEDFRAQVDDWAARGVCFEWAKGFHQWDDDGRGVRPPDPSDDSHPRYACRAGMSALGKDLAAGLAGGTVRLGARVTAVRRAGEEWRVAVEGTEEGFAARRVLVTLPPPQALALFEGDDLDPEARRALETVETTPSIAVLLRGEVSAPDWQAIQLRDAAISWLAMDSDKREEEVAGGRIFVLHGSGPFSLEWQEEKDIAEGARRMVARAGEIVGDWITRLPDRQVHRWRHAGVLHGWKDGLFMRAAGGLFFGGDSFHEPKIEGAWRSGQEAARALLEEG